jgi:hypothetical protein
LLIFFVEKCLFQCLSKGGKKRREEGKRKGRGGERNLDLIQEVTVLKYLS